jgi:hypothetical protein
MNLIHLAAICIYERSSDAQTFDDYIEYVARELLEYSKEESDQILHYLLPMMSEFIRQQFPATPTESRSRSSTIELIPATELEKE